MSTSVRTPAAVTRPAEQRSRWSRVLDAVVPAPSPDRLVPVAEISRESLGFTLECLEDVGVLPVVQQVGSMPGTATRFRILVAARDRELAGQVVRID